MTDTPRPTPRVGDAPEPMPDDEDFCPATSDGYFCTRELGHTDDHVANGITKVCAVWPQA